MVIFCGIAMVAHADYLQLVEGGNTGNLPPEVTDTRVKRNTIGQDTTTGCAENPQSGNKFVAPPIEPLPTAELQFVAQTTNYDRVTSVQPNDNGSSTNIPRRPTYPNEPGSPVPNPEPPLPPSPSTTPEPGTLLIMGIGLAGLLPFARRKRDKA